MAVRAASAPSTRDIFSIPGPFPGHSVDPGVNNMGLGGPNVPMTVWEPRGADGRFQAQPANFLKHGVPPVSHGHIELSTMPITWQYLCPPLNDHADLLLMPDMPVFGVNQMDPEESSNLLLTLSKVNCLMQNQFADHELARKPDTQYYVEDHWQFHEWMQKYGEAGLEHYAHVRASGNTEKISALSELRSFWEMAQTSEFCWLTSYGILKRINFLGIIITANRGVGIETIDQTLASEHYTQVTVGVAKRVRCAQLFGNSTDITTGSNVWITLSRKYLGKNKYGAFQLKPGGSKHRDRPLVNETTYLDESGVIQSGHVFRVGVVIEPASSNPSSLAVELANNTGYQTSERNSMEAHATIPTCYLALGY